MWMRQWLPLSKSLALHNPNLNPIHSTVQKIARLQTHNSDEHHAMVSGQVMSFWPQQRLDEPTTVACKNALPHFASVNGATPALAVPTATKPAIVTTRVSE